MWHSSADSFKYPTYPTALAIAVAAGRGSEFQAYCTQMDADSSDSNRELCRGFDFWRRQFPEIPAYKPSQQKSDNVIRGSFSTGIASACKSDVSWSEGLVIATQYGLEQEYRSRNGFPVENYQGLDTSFWVWADRNSITADDCAKIWNTAPALEWDDFRVECIQGSDIRPSMVDLNIQRIMNSGSGRYQVLETLNIYASRFFESSDGENWNRISTEEKEQKFGGEIYAFFGENGFFNAKPRVATWDGEKGKYRKYEARRKKWGGKEEGNKIFFPYVDRVACELLVENFNLFFLDVTPDNYWDVVLAYPKQIRVGIAEGAKKAISLTAEGFPCVAVLGVTNWSVSGSDPRQLLPELAELATGDRSIDVWYDMDDPIQKLKAFISGKSQGHKLLAELKAAGAHKKSRMMFWDLALGKGIDDAKAVMRSRGEDVRAWILGTIELSRYRETYDQTWKAYQFAPNRPIERDTVGDYLPGDIKVQPGFTTAIVADTGSGKTHQIRDFIDNCKALGIIALVFTPTNKLGEQAAYNFGIPHRNSVGEDGRPMEIGDVLAEARRRGGLVCCPDSIDWARSLIKNLPSYVVVCDEAAKVLEHLSSGTTIKDRYSEINENFAELIKNAQSLILAEAKLSEEDLLAYEAMSGKSTLVYRHRRETAKKQVKIYTGAPGATFAALLSEVVERLSAGERVVIPTDSQRMAIKIEMFLQELVPHLRGIRNDAQTSYIPDVKELTRNPNKFLADRQLDYLIYSPVCKAGWDLKGFDDEIEGIRREYHFDAVCAFFCVLPTSDQVQMIARYRVVVPLSIACPELINQVGDEINLSGKILRKLRGEELAANIQFCGFSDKPRAEVPLQSTMDRVYIHNSIRNGLEKSIARYALQQRLIDDGHTVITEPVSLREIKGDDPDRYETLRGICQRLKVIGESIDRNWGDLIASITLSPEDDIKEATRIDRMEAPEPKERAKAAKIRLQARFPGVQFDCQTAYYATRKYGKSANGADLHAKLLFSDLVKAAQRERNAAILNENIIAVHHFDKTAQRVALMLQVGILDLLTEEYSQYSPELIKLQKDCVDRARNFKRFFGLNFNLDQSPTEIYRRLLSKLSLKTLPPRRPGADPADPNQKRPRFYRVATQSLVEAEIEQTTDKIEILKAQIEIVSSDSSIELERRSKRILELTRFEADHISKLEASRERVQNNPSDFATALELKRTEKAAKASARVKLAIYKMETFEASAAGRLEAKIARLEGVVIPSLLELANEIVARDALFVGALLRLTDASTTPINKEDIGVVDVTTPCLKDGGNLLQMNLNFEKKIGI
jgi:hypothetical protein